MIKKLGYTETIIFVRVFQYTNLSIYRRLATARIGAQDKQVITHYGPPTLLTAIPMTRCFTKISGPLHQSEPQIFCPPFTGLGFTDHINPDNKSTENFLTSFVSFRDKSFVTGEVGKLMGNTLCSVHP